ncbi:hypothetical protein ADICYQ_3289 [Cyclobacterium qasimii M12-11B]|uniref:Uncharacterized protein n=1 Tax=Cyclobacterium qasimii M12-11B TaxID=641524 RepID=S7WLN3_9BACT|nr:hypothetical protein ADICYQ_3289 [Cyclobacterium qasimii M12-11B]
MFTGNPLIELFSILRDKENFNGFSLSSAQLKSLEKKLSPFFQQQKR